MTDFIKNTQHILYHILLMCNVPMISERAGLSRQVFLVYCRVVGAQPRNTNIAQFFTLDHGQVFMLVVGRILRRC